MLYRDKKSVPATLEELRAIPLPERENVRVWKGVQHGLLADTVLAVAEDLNLHVESHSWLVSKTSTAMWGEVVVSPEGYDIPGTNLAIGIRHGNMSEFSLSFAVGAKVVVCSNGMFVGGFKSSKRHSHSLDLNDFVLDSLKRWVAEATVVPKYIEAWKGVELSNKDVTELLFDSEREDVVPLRYLPKILEEWKYPRHPDFKDRTAWSLYNSYTEVAKTMPVSTQTTMYNGLITLFSNRFDTHLTSLSGMDSEEGELIEIA